MVTHQFRLVAVGHGMVTHQFQITLEEKKFIKKLRKNLENENGPQKMSLKNGQKKTRQEKYLIGFNSEPLKYQPITN